jgi:6-pyruvoyltetrahydropterin/6-carboxytetrahydropterin synthase
VVYELKVIRVFSAAHRLQGYKGKCEELHGHNYRVEVELSVSGLDDIGLGMDFQEIKSCLDEILKGLDHRFLNEVPPFDRDNPSAENLARYIYEEMKKRISRGSAGPERASMLACTIWESDTAAATYRE